MHAAFPFGALDDLGDLVTVNDEIGTADILVIYHGWSRTAQAFDIYHGWSRTAQAFDRVVDGQLLTFSVADTASQLLVDTETGSEWNLKGIAITGPLAGMSLEPIATSYTLFWFAWSVYHPNTVLFE